jgi:glutaconate CoA-transferase subunit A
VPFIPSRGVIGTDLVNLHPNWKIIEDPYNEGHDILLVPAIRPDIAIIHAFKADRSGNILAPGYDDRMIAQASDKVIVTVEEIVDYDLTEDSRGGHVIPWPFISLVVHVPAGSHPGGMKPYYKADDAHFAQYMEAAKTGDGFARYLDEFVRGHTEDEYQELVTRVPVTA